MVAGHVRLDISCLDRLYLNGFVGKLQTPGGVVWFFHDHRGKPIVSPALFEPIGEKFRRDIKSWAQASGIPVIVFKAGERKAEVMAPYLQAAAAAGRSRVVGRRLRPGVSAGVDGAQAGHRSGQVPAVFLHQGAAPGVGVLRLHLRRADGAGVHQDLHLLPVSGQGLGQRAVCRDRRYAAGSRCSCCGLWVEALLIRIFLSVPPS
jgi:hypothetical protein